MDVFNVSTDNLFPTSSQKSATLDNLAQRALSAGLGQFTSQQYDLAITSFKRAASLSPLSDIAINAYDYMARAHLTKGETQAAIDAYNKALRIDPSRDDIHVQLGNLFTTQERADEARDQYELAVKYNPGAANRYSLGQGYLRTGQYSEAARQFELVQQMDGKNPYGYFGLGQTYAKQGRYEQAVAAFKDAIGIKYNYWDAYSEMGYALADSGEIDAAQELVATLEPNDEALAALLNQYIFEKTKPRMTALYTSELYAPFLSTLGPGTLVAGLSSYLANAGDEQTLSLVFQFDKPMDAASVENVFNWNISRAPGTGRGDGYNLNMALPATEVSLAQTPLAVYYDRQDLTATVLFTIRQNAGANGTIDPSHINFTFSGKDVLGLSMDSAADQYSGFSSFA